MKQVMDTQDYLLQCLAEEGLEVAHAISKIKRFTLHHYAPGSSNSNLDNLKLEYNDFIAVVELLSENGLHLHRDAFRISEKKRKLKEYMEISKGLGTLSGEEKQLEMPTTAEILKQLKKDWEYLGDL